jgi:ADP-L-glycero-D-manno-heptose 6-epimerase
MIFVTGSNGFIARNLIARIDGQVGCYDTANRTDQDILAILDYINWKDVEKIIHLGAISNTTETDMDLLYDHNVRFTLKLFEKACEHGIPLDYASSASVYGNSKDYSLSPLNYYAVTKMLVDMYVEDNIESFPLIRGFRFFNVYGPNEGSKFDQASPYYKFRKQAIETGKIQVFEGSENFKRDFIHVKDVITIIHHCIKSSGIYDVGSAVPKTFMEVAEEVAEEFKASIEVIPFPEHLVGKYQESTCAQDPWSDIVS